VNLCFWVINYEYLSQKNDTTKDKVTHGNSSCSIVAIGSESVPNQLAQCWFPGLAISNAKIQYTLLIRPVCMLPMAGHGFRRIWIGFGVRRPPCNLRMVVAGNSFAEKPRDARSPWSVFECLTALGNCHGLKSPDRQTEETAWNRR